VASLVIVVSAVLVSYVRTDRHSDTDERVTPATVAGVSV